MKKIVRLLASVAVLFTCLFYGYFISSYAEEEKIVQVPINKNYTSARFTLTFDYYDDYVVVIKSPSDKEYKGTLESENIVSCVVDDVEVGQWEVKITLPSNDSSLEGTSNAIEGASASMEGSSEETEEQTDNDITGQRSISPVKVKVEGSTESLVSVDKGITVATDIAGLKMYFKDDNFVAEWTDTTCGNINIEVINAKNLQKIDSQTVQGNSYMCPLDTSIEEIMVTIVPSVSSSVEGAANSYTYKFDNNPDATVTYEELTITNHDSILVTCALNEKYHVQIEVNGKQVEKTDLLETGSYEFEVPLEVGQNDIYTYIVDEDNNMRSTSYSVTKDVVGPSLELVSSYEDIVTQDEYITIEGAVNDFSKLMINNAEIEVEGDNTFKYDYSLKEGVNQIAVIASDEAGNETEYDIAVEQIIPEEKPVPWLKIIICASLIGLLVIYTIEIIKRKNNPEKYEKKKEKADEKYSAYDNVDISGLSKKEKKDILKGPDIIWDVLSFGVPLAAAFFVLSFVIMVSVVQSESMDPVLKVGNTVFYNRLAYINSEPQRGDVIAFYSQEYGAYFGKRIIGVPGDVISFKDGYVVINNQFCDETAYIDTDVETNCTKTFEVPEGCYFVLGDNRENSNDSRYWQEPYISADMIKGKYMGQIDFSFQYDILCQIMGN
ncbi:MAG: signal peptidase I [Butyrivibrio sp.]|nr:signal peptidase I [Butyrivibrio sp.]